MRLLSLQNKRKIESIQKVEPNRLASEVTIFVFRGHHKTDRSVVAQVINANESKSIPFRVKVEVLTPITWPYESINGPPEFPVQMPYIRSWKRIMKSTNLFDNGSRSKTEIDTDDSREKQYFL